MRVLAELFQPAEVVTPHGGRAVTHEDLGVVWLETGALRRRERTEADRARSVETLEAGTRADPRLAEGRMLTFGGGDWTIRAVEADPARPGRLSLTLERGR